MSDGKTHDLATIVTSPLVCWASAACHPSVAIPVTTGYLIGGLLLSPDLDIPSRPWRRWGWLRFLWVPYQKMVPHRSWISHTPIVGTLIQLAYLGAIVLGVGLLVGVNPATIQEIWTDETFATTIGAFVVGLCAGSFCHLLLDGWSSGLKRRQRRRKQR